MVFGLKSFQYAVPLCTARITQRLLTGPGYSTVARAGARAVFCDHHSMLRIIKLDRDDRGRFGAARRTQGDLFPPLPPIAGMEHCSAASSSPYIVTNDGDHSKYCWLVRKYPRPTLRRGALQVALRRYAPLGMEGARVANGNPRSLLKFVCGGRLCTGLSGFTGCKRIDKGSSRGGCCRGTANSNRGRLPNCIRRGSLCGRRTCDRFDGPIGTHCERIETLTRDILGMR